MKESRKTVSLKIFLLSLFLFSLLSECMYAQSPQISWQHTIGGSGNEDLRSVVENEDGSYVIAGYSSSGISGDKQEANLGNPNTTDYWVMKLNSSGNMVWQNTIGGDINDALHCVRHTQDGGYILGGWSSSTNSGDKSEPNFGVFDIWIVKLDSTGAIEWQNAVGGDSEDKLRVLEPTPDGGYICGGYSKSGISEDKSEGNYGDLDYWVFKLNSLGQIEWDHTIGGDAEDVLRAISPTKDGGYIVGGYSRSGVSGDKTAPSIGDYDYWIVKLDAAGAIEWQRTIGGTDEDKCRALKQTFDGGYICGGASFSGISGDKNEASQGQHDVWLVKLDATGDIEWQNSLGGTGDDILYALHQTSDSGYIFGGYSRSGISPDKSEPSQGNYDFWAVKLNAAGEKMWDKTIGGSGDDEMYDITPTSDGGYICAGFSNSNISGNKTENSKGGYDYWVVKLACAQVLWYADGDGDGYGNPAQSTNACLGPSGFVANNLDCDDANAAVNPEATEIANGVDDNCNGMIDEGLCIAPKGLTTTGITANTALLGWMVNDVAKKYKIKYSYTSGPNMIAVVNDPDSAAYLLSNLLPSHDYSWRIKSVCNGSHSPYSKKQKFTTAAMKMMVQPLTTNAFGLTAFPNPCNDEVTISFTLESACAFTILITDVYGKVFKTISKGTTEAGNQTLTLDVAQLPASIYFAHLYTDAGKECSVKMVKQQ